MESLYLPGLGRIRAIRVGADAFFCEADACKVFNASNEVRKTLAEGSITYRFNPHKKTATRAISTAKLRELANSANVDDVISGFVGKKIVPYVPAPLDLRREIIRLKQSDREHEIMYLERKLELTLAIKNAGGM
jgi:hypothetical protein